jgi:uncharacterized protein YprB with RNaseH-like and TPR domain
VGQGEDHSYCVLDIETTAGDFRRLPDGFRLLLAGLKWGSSYWAFPAEAERLQALACFLDSFGGAVVTFNGTRFDLPILDHTMRQSLKRGLVVRRHYDILVQITRVIGHRISLAELARLNLQTIRKLPWDHTRNARIWEEAPHLLQEYNRADLALTAAIVDILRSGQPLRTARNEKAWLPPP